MPADASNGAAPSTGGLGGKVAVFGDNFLAGPLFETREARTVAIYDSDGICDMLLVRMADDTWGLATAADSDWAGVKARFGVE